MRNFRRRTALRAFAGGTLALFSRRAYADHIDSKNSTKTDAASLQVIIGFSKGSASDGLLSLMQPELREILGRPVEISFLPGELGAIAARSVINRPPDGNTLLVATFGTHAINPNLKKDLGYDPIKDFAPVCLATRSPLILGVGPSLQVRTIKDLIATAQTRALTYGSSGVGSAPYLAALLFQKMTGVKMTHRPYGDTRALYEDLAQGRLDLSFNNAASMMMAVNRGQAFALATTAAHRSEAFPTLMTLDEYGLKGYQLDNWLGFVAPPGTPPTILDAQALAITASLRAPEVSGELSKSGIDVIGGSPSEFAEFISSELKRWDWLRNTL